MATVEDFILEIESYIETVGIYDENPSTQMAMQTVVVRLSRLISNIFPTDEKKEKYYLDWLKQIDTKYPIWNGGYYSPTSLPWQKDQFFSFIQVLKDDIRLFSSMPSAQSSTTQPQSTLSAPPPAQNSTSNRVFIVHGHDDLMKHTVARVVERIGLEAVILHEQPSKGKTIIEKFIEYSDVGCAIVLLSPDDLAIRKDATSGEPTYRARQNVILELGFFIGRLGRERVFALYKQEEKFEIPSDFSGVLYIPYHNPEGTWRLALAKELQQLGYSIDFTKLY